MLITRPRTALYLPGLKPPLGTPIDTEHPLTLGLVGAWLLNEGSNLVYNTALRFEDGASVFTAGTALPSWGVGTFGSELTYGGANDTTGRGQRIEVGSNARYQIQDQTVVLWVRTGSITTAVAHGSAYCLLSRAVDITTGGFEWAIHYNSGSPRFAQAFYNGAVQGWYLDTTVLSASTEYFLVGTWTSGSARFYVNNVFSSGSSTGTGPITHLAADVLQIGYQGTVSNNQNTSFDGQIHQAYLYNRVLSDSEIAALYAEPFQMWRPRDAARYTLYQVPPTLQYARPSSDTSVGTWTTDTGATTNLYAAIDETTASDADYIQSTANPQASAVEVALSSATDPNVDTDHAVKIRALIDQVAGGAVSLTTELRNGASAFSTPISWTDTLATVAAGITHPLTTAQADLIHAASAYGSLRLRWTATQASLSAPTLVGIGAIARTATNGATITPAFPASYTAVAGDVELLVVMRDDTSAPTAPSGYTNIAGLSGANANGSHATYVYYRVFTGGETATAITYGTSTINRAGRRLIVRGCDTTTPIQTSSRHDNASGTSATSTNISPTGADLGLMIVSANVAATSTTSSGGWSAFDSATSTLSAIDVSNQTFASGGSFGTPSATLSTTGISETLLVAFQPTTNASRARITWADFELPAGAGGTTTPVTVSATQAQTLVLVKTGSLIRLDTQTQVVALQKQAQPIRALTQAQLLALRKQANLSRATTQAQSVGVVKQVALIRAVTQAQAATVTALRLLLRTISATQAQSVALLKQANVIRAMTQTQAVSRVKQANLSRTVTQAQSVARQIQVALVRLDTQAQAVALTTLKVLLRTVSAVQAQTAALVKQVNIPRSIVQAQVGSSGRQVNLSRLVSQAQTLTSLKLITLARVVSQSQSLSIATLKALFLTLSVSQAQAAVLVKRISLPRAASTVVQAISLSQQTNLIRSVVQAQAVAVVKQVNLRRTVTQAQAAVVTTLKVLLRTVNATQAQVVVLVKQVGLTRIDTVSQVAVLVQRVSLIRALPQTQAAVLQKTAALIRAATQAQAVSATAQRLFARTIIATQAQAANLRKTLTASRSVAQPQILRMAQAISLTLTSSQGQSATVRQLVTLMRATSIGQVAGVVAAFIPSAVAMAPAAVLVVSGRSREFAVTSRDRVLEVVARLRTLTALDR